MKKIKFPVIIISIIICGSISNISYCQRSPDLGIMLSTNNLNRLILEYRKPFGEEHRFKIGASYGESSNQDPWERIIAVNDSLFTERVTTNSIKAVNLRFGVERQIKASMFSFGADLLIGYRSTIRSRKNSYILLGNAGSWRNPHPYLNPKGFDPKESQVRQHFIIPGLQWHLSMDLPLGVRNQLFLNIRYVAQLGIERHLKDTEILDPLNEYGDLETAPTLTIFNAHSRFGIGLKYKIDKNKTE